MITHPPLRIGIVGIGGIARGQHIPGYQLCDDVEIIALCDVNEATLARAGADLDVEHLTTDFEELVRMDDLDAVSVCTYPNTHHAVTMAALAAGKHVFCEKPLALTYPLAREMYETALNTGVKTGIGFTHRLTPAAQLAHHLISTRALGDIYHISATYSMGVPGFADREIAPRFTKAVTGGGPLFELGPHMVDMVRWWTGLEITSVCAQTRTFINRRRDADTGAWIKVDIEDAATFMTDMEGCTTALFSHSSAVSGRNFDQRAEVYGSKGALLYDQARPYEVRACIGREMVELCADYGIYDPLWGLHRQEEPYPVIPVPRRFVNTIPRTREGKPLRSFIPDFVASIRGEEPPLLPTFYEGMKAQEVLDAVLISAAGRRWVDLPLKIV